MTKNLALGLFSSLCLVLVTKSPFKSPPPVHAQTYSSPLQNRAPLKQMPLIKLPLGSVQPEGWTKQQFQRMWSGLLGHLPEIQPDIFGEDTDLLQNKGIGWELTVYYLRGLILLAFQLDNPLAKERATEYINHVLNLQQDDGSFKGSDWWSSMLVLDCLRLYYEATGDLRCKTAMEKYFSYQATHLPDQFTSWDHYRGGENVDSALWLYNRNGDPSLLDLIPLIWKRTHDRTNPPNLGDYGSKHGVNVAMGIKYPALRFLTEHKTDLIDTTYSRLKEILNQHRHVSGVFSGDEFLHGTGANQGVEMCLVAEYLLSMSRLLEITGDQWFADLLEQDAFNALPAGTLSDYTSHQYFLQGNQVRLFQLLPGQDQYPFTHFPSGVSVLFKSARVPPEDYPCCTANLHLGWGELLLSAWYATANGLATGAYLPNEVHTQLLSGGVVKIKEQTDYPFKPEVQMQIIESPGFFELKLRIPAWAQSYEIKVNGEKVAGGKGDNPWVTLNRNWIANDIIEIVFQWSPLLSGGGGKPTTVHLGPLVFAYEIPSQAIKAEEVIEGFSSWRFEPTGDWNYALVANDSHTLQAKSWLVYSESPIVNPWASPPLRLKVPAQKVDWVRATSVCAQEPPSNPRPLGELEQIDLVPFGSTNKLRIAKFPTISVPTFTIQGLKKGCPEGTKLWLNDSIESVECAGYPGSYCFYNTPVGTHTVSLELPTGSPPYDLSSSPCDCCTNHPDNSFIRGSSHTFTKETTCYYDLYWQCKRKGDLNNDGQVNSQDLKILLENWGDPSRKPEADLNVDGVINGVDFGKLRKLIR